jgi:hypothetical protein
MHHVCFPKLCQPSLLQAARTADPSCDHHPIIPPPPPARPATAALYSQQAPPHFQRPPLVTRLVLLPPPGRAVMLPPPPAVAAAAANALALLLNTPLWRMDIAPPPLLFGASWDGRRLRVMPPGPRAVRGATVSTRAVLQHSSGGDSRTGSVRQPCMCMSLCMLPMPCLSGVCVCVCVQPQ